jgi:hypothetical protein
MFEQNSKLAKEPDSELTKAQSRAKFTQLLNRAKVEFIFEQGSDEYDFCILITRGLSVVYSEFEKPDPPKFCIKLTSNKYKRGLRTLHVWNTTAGKWVPLTAEKIFSLGTKSSKKKRVQAAFRTAIKGQIDYIRASTSVPFICPLSGLNITSKATCHVDHYGPMNFQKILEQWLNLYNLNYDDIGLDRKGDIKDPDVFKSWYNFHKEKADLRLVDKTANLKKGARGTLF